MYKGQVCDCPSAPRGQGEVRLNGTGLTPLAPAHTWLGASAAKELLPVTKGLLVVAKGLLQVAKGLLTVAMGLLGYWRSPKPAKGCW